MIQLVLNGHKHLFQIFPIFLKVLQLFECRRGDPNMTANRIKPMNTSNYLLLCPESFVSRHEEGIEVVAARPEADHGGCCL